MSASKKIHQLYLKLLKKHGDPETIWPQWCAKKKTSQLRELIALGAILTQRTSWHNADLALGNLKKAGLLSLKKIASLKNLDGLTNLIRPAGFYQTKPRRLHSFCSFVIKKYGNLENFLEEDFDIARHRLLSVYGIGPETADAILLYALDRPSFVVDEYTKKLVKKRNLASKFSYDYLKKLFEKNLPRQVPIYQNFHALIIIEQRGREASMMKVV